MGHTGHIGSCGWGCAACDRVVGEHRGDLADARIALATLSLCSAPAAREFAGSRDSARGCELQGFSTCLSMAAVDVCQVSPIGFWLSRAGGQSTHGPPEVDIVGSAGELLCRSEQQLSGTYFNVLHRWVLLELAGEACCTCIPSRDSCAKSVLVLVSLALRVDDFPLQAKKLQPARALGFLLAAEPDA
jgi:hypothetical protein